MNAVEIEAAVSELALQPFDAAEFPFAFLSAFGHKDTALKRLRAGDNNASDLLGGVLLRNSAHIAVCAAGAVGDTFGRLRASPIACDYPELANHLGFFLPLAGITTIQEIKDNPIDVRATGRLNKLFELYTQMTSQGAAGGTTATAKKTRRRRVAS